MTLFDFMTGVILLSIGAVCGYAAFVLMLLSEFMEGDM